MKDRLKEVRKAHVKGKTQDTFAKFLGVPKENISSYETGRRNPSDAFVHLVCEKCDVNYEWLKNGIGEMFVEKSKDEQISEMLGEIQRSGEDSFKHRLVTALSELDENGWEALEKLIDSIAKK